MPGISDEELLEALAVQGQAPSPEPSMDWLSALTQTEAPVENASPSDAPVPPVGADVAPKMTRQEMLLQSLQRPTSGQHGMAAMFDSLLGGTKYSDDVRSRRNQFDQAMLGAQSADVSSAQESDRRAQDEAYRQEQLEIQRRGQTLTAEQREEDRKLREQMAAERLESQKLLQSQRDVAALERAKIAARHGGSGGPVSPEAKEEREKVMSDMEASYLAGRVSSPGQPPVSMDTVQAYLEGTLEPGKLSPAQEEGIKRGKAMLAGLKGYDGKKYAELLKGGESREAGIDDTIGRGAEAKRLDPKERVKLKTELSNVKAQVTDAINSWNQMHPTAKEIFVKASGNESALIENLKKAGMSPEDQARAGAVWTVANELIKSRAGSAVTDSEWVRVANEIGFPSTGWSVFNDPKSLGAWLNRTRAGYIRRRDAVMSEYPDLLKEQ